MLLARVPRPALGAALLAFLIAAYDIVHTILALLRPEGTGAVFGTFLRDVLLLLGAVMLVRRARWAAWMLGLLFVFSLVRVLVADDWAAFLFNALAIPGVVLLLLSETRRWLDPARARTADGDAAEPGDIAPPPT